MSPDGEVGHRFPWVWLGQTTDTRILAAADPEMAGWPSLLSLGDAMRRPHAASLFRGAVGAKLGLTGRVLVDSGGFTLTQRAAHGWTPLRVREIYRNLEADLLVSLDYPPAPGDDGVSRLTKIRASVDSYRIIAEGLEGRAVMPVVHGRTPLEIDHACELISRTGFRGPVIGLGGLVPLLQRSARDSRVHLFIGSAIRSVRAAFPRAALHIFGAGSPQTMQAMFALGASSADSLAWRHAAAFGGIYLRGSAQRLVTWSDNARAKPRPLIGPADLDLLSTCRCPTCRGRRMEARLRRLRTRFAHRALHNAWTLYQEFVPARREAPFDRNLPALTAGWRAAIDAAAAC